MELYRTCLMLICLVVNVQSETREAYLQQAQIELTQALNVVPNVNVAKNVVLFIGDGMGMASITAGRIYGGQLDNMGTNDVKAQHAFEKFPHVGLSKTYNNDRQVSASASSGTAILCGVKVNFGTVGLDGSVLRQDCEEQKKETGYIYSILKQSKDEGKSVGIVTTARVTHATPSSAYAHSSDRNWESTLDIVNSGKTGCADIASQLIDNGDIDVILGGGRRNFYLDNQTDPQTGGKSSHHRTDGRDLIKEWLASKKAMGKMAHYVWNKTDFDNVNPETTDYLFGMFNPSHMKYDVERNNSEPSLEDMARKAIKILEKNDKGYFLLVEGARIDHGNHENYGKRALHDVVALSKAVQAAADVTKEDDTLIVVTSDHASTLNFNGYPSRGNDILGLVDKVQDDEAAKDGMPYLTLTYANGPGKTRRNLTGVDTHADDFQQTVGVVMNWEKHSGDDVPIYARGPMAHLFHGVHQQHYITMVMRYASCVGPNKAHCNKPVYPVCTQTSECTQGAGTLGSALFTILAALYINWICV